MLITITEEEYKELMEIKRLHDKNVAFKELIGKQEPLGEEFSKVLNDNFWELCEDA